MIIEMCLSADETQLFILGFNNRILVYDTKTLIQQKTLYDD